MAHKTLIGGTAYNIVGGKSLVSGTAYNIKKGRTLVNGTGYNINFTLEATAMLYSTGDFAFQRGNEVESGKTLVNSYTGFEDRSYSQAKNVPWNVQRANIKNVYCNEEVAPSSMGYWFNNCVNLVRFNIANFNINNVTNMCYTYRRCTNLTGSPVCGDNVINMSYTYYYCTNLTGSPVCGNKVTNMAEAYDNCTNLTGSPICGNNVTSMIYTYNNCTNLTGSPACGDNVINMAQAYRHCTNLTGSPVCGNKVTNMYATYTNCTNLTGFPACGDNVINMSYTYYGCKNLTGSPICGNNVTGMYYTYSGCTNLTGNAYLYSLNVNNVCGCFERRNIFKQLNIYVPRDSTTNTTIHYTNIDSLVGSTITWANAGTYQYNTGYNIYIYPVANVAAARAANGD